MRVRVTAALGLTAITVLATPDVSGLGAGYGRKPERPAQHDDVTAYLWGTSCQPVLPSLDPPTRRRRHLRPSRRQAEREAARAPHRRSAEVRPGCRGAWHSISWPASPSAGTGWAPTSSTARPRSAWRSPNRPPAGRGRRRSGNGSYRLQFGVHLLGPEGHSRFGACITEETVATPTSASSSRPATPLLSPAHLVTSEETSHSRCGSRNARPPRAPSTFPLPTRLCPAEWWTLPMRVVI